MRRVRVTNDPTRVMEEFRNVTGTVVDENWCRMVRVRFDTPVDVPGFDSMTDSVFFRRDVKTCS